MRFENGERKEKGEKKVQNKLQIFTLFYFKHPIGFSAYVLFIATNYYFPTYFPSKLNSMCNFTGDRTFF